MEKIFFETRSEKLNIQTTRLFDHLQLIDDCDLLHKVNASVIL